MTNKATPPRSAYGPTGGGNNPPTSAGHQTGNAASDVGKAVSSAKRIQQPKRVGSAKPGGRR